ncbi:ABC transporter permease subunit [Candidatus Villigracilis saccharophilus]|uniref:ABC transporter permease subunit n=1 Tax=Candidatus Villigracilis saccharophilus TaxID=3140684 RepID=UPI0031376C56|nr:ABC transporter permease subunit [Anaerolineales bacterium]
MKHFQIPLRILAILLVIFIAWTLRARAVSLLPIDFDEDDYLRAGQEYAHLIRTSNWSGFLETNYRPEHPPLAKIIIGLSILSAPEEPLTPEALTSAGPNKFLARELVNSARTVNAILGTVTVAILALINPLAGLFLAGHTFTIKYVSQIMLEALPALTSLIAVLSYLKWKQSKRSGFNGWLVLSAISLGLTAASKYLYCVVGIAILVDWYLDANEKDTVKASLRTAGLWGVLAIVTFFIFDPFLWPNPITRLGESIFYHAGYASGATEVDNAGYPIWQPIFWIFFSPSVWHKGVFVFPFDPFIATLAFFGLKRLWTRERLYVLWLGIAMLFLFFWPTKWPQYIITLTVPLSIAAAEGIFLFKDNLVTWWQTRKTRAKIHYPKAEIRRALPWLIPGLIAFAILTLFPLLFQFGVSLTNFSTASIRDGFNGGIWRSISQGITGQLPTMPGEIGTRADKVNFVGLNLYPNVFSFIAYNNNWSVLFFNVLWTVLSVLLQCGLGLGVALLLWQRGVRLGKFWQALFILPWAIPEMIGAMMWVNIFQRDWGWLYLAADKFGKESFFAVSVNALEQSASMWLIVFLLPAVWYGFPFMMLAASIGLKTVPKEVLDAAAIDGASIWQTFKYVTWPLLLPLLIPAIIVRGIFAFNQFYLFQAFGFPDSTLATLSYNIFNPTNGFGRFGGQFAVSATINIITVILLMFFVMLFNRWSKAGEGVTYA